MARSENDTSSRARGGGAAGRSDETARAAHDVASGDAGSAGGPVGDLHAQLGNRTVDEALHGELGPVGVEVGHAVLGWGRPDGGLASNRAVQRRMRAAAALAPIDAALDADADGTEELLVSYLAFLQQQFDVRESAGVGRGHRLESHPAARGVIDYWRSADGERWAVKGWVDRERLAVLMVRGPDDYPHFNAAQLYFDGYRFQP